MTEGQGDEGDDQEDWEDENERIWKLEKHHTENQSPNEAEGWNTIYHTRKFSRASGEMLVEEGDTGKNRLRANEGKSCLSCFRRKEINRINYNY